MEHKKEEHRKPFFYGWVIVFACLLLSATSTGILSYFSALFVEPVTSELGFARAEYMMYSTFATITSMIAMPLIGTLYQKLHVKIMLLAGAAIGAGALFIFSCSSNLIGFYCGGILGGLGMSTFGGIPIAILLSNWFQEKRGFVTGIAFTGSAIVSSVFSPVVSNVIAASGWRTAYRGLALAILLIMIPTVLLLIKVRPADMGLRPYGSAPVREDDSPEQLGFSKKEAIRMPAFWIFALSVFLMGMFTPGTQQHLVAYWSGSGSSAETAARLYSMVMLISMFAKIGMGSLFDQFRTRTACILCGLIASAGFLSLLVCTSSWTVLIPVVLFGITTALQVMASTYLTNKFFGEKDYGTLYGLINTALFLGVSVGVTFSALVYDATGGYQMVWTIYAAAAGLMTALLVTADKLSIAAFKEKLSTERKA